MLQKYTLCSSSARESTDLWKFEKKIMKAVLAVKSNAQVHVEKDCYYADLTRGEEMFVMMLLKMKLVFYTQEHFIIYKT